MNNKKSFLKNSITVFIVLTAFLSMAFTAMEKDNKNGKRLSKTTDKAGDAYRMQINNVDLPLDRTGVIADVQFGGDAGGHFDGNVFLYSSGFFLSGKTNGTLWANGVASASRVQDYVPGTVKGGRNDSRAQLYVVSKEDGAFAQSWVDWKDAVDLGAEFYDGDGDGEYNPVDLNSNGKWDANEDMPDLLGDETVWCVYNDGTDPVLRTWNGVLAQGIEIRQTVFGFASKGLLGNIVFVRYNIQNTGLKADVLDSCYFGVWADPDVGDHLNDLVGCDTTLNAGFVYDNGPDGVYGSNSPCFLIDFFQGPYAYIPGETFEDANGNGVFDDGETALTYATNLKGQIRGIDSIAGAKNQGLSSFVHYIQSHPDIGDPDNHIEARRYMLGLNQQGLPIDPCNWAFGNVLGGVNCSQVDNRYWYSGDPVAGIGWVNNNPADERQMSNTGPFQLEKGKPVVIVAAYVVGRGSSSLASVNEAKKISNFAQFVYDYNFRTPPTPPSVKPIVSTNDNFIDILWNTNEQVNFTDSTIAWNLKFEGFNVYAYRTGSTAEVVDNVNNIKLLTSYDMNNYIQNIYKENPDTKGIEKLYSMSSSENQLNYKIFGDPTTGKIRLRLSTDPFTGGPLIKGKEYYFAITGYALNYDALYHKGGEAVGDTGDYVLSGAAFTAESENIPQLFTVVMGEDLYNPPYDVIAGEKADGPSDGAIQYDIVEKDNLTGDTYKVEFSIDSSKSSYETFWRLTNQTSGTILIDSSKQYLYGSTTLAPELIREGFILRVKSLTADVGTPNYTASGDSLVKAFSEERGTGAFYVGNDIPDGQPIPAGNSLGDLAAKQSTITKADRLRKVELRFGENGKAYRYVNGYGGVFSRAKNYMYAEGVAATDTANTGGGLDKFGQGFVDVPFTAWVTDSVYGETRQLAVGFLEKSRTTGGNPDGVWNPGDSIKSTCEYIFIFDSDYDPSGNQIQYKGGTFGTKTVWADLKGYTIPATATEANNLQKQIAKSGLFNSLYVVGVETKSSTITTGSKITIPVSVYPYTNKDMYTFKTTKDGELAETDKKELFKKVNVFPNPLFAFNPATSYNNGNPDDPFVTFSNLPDEVTIKIFTLSGVLIRSLNTNDKAGGPTSPFLRWDLLNSEGLRVASGMYLAIVSSPEFGEKILKFAIVMPQKQIQRF